MLRRSKHFMIVGVIAAMAGATRGQSPLPAPGPAVGFAGGASVANATPAANPGLLAPVAPVSYGQPTGHGQPAAIQVPGMRPQAMVTPASTRTVPAATVGHATPAVGVAGPAMVEPATVGSVMPFTQTSWGANESEVIAEGQVVGGDAMMVTDCGPEACDVGCEPCNPLWTHFSGIHASLLYWRPRNMDVAYGVPIDGPIIDDPGNNPIQVGQVGVVDFDYELGFDVGFNLACNSMTSLYADLVVFDANTTNSISTEAPDVIRSLVSHPSSTSAATDYLTASAELDLSMKLLDAGIRHLFVGGQNYAVNYSVGARYGKLDQQFGATFVDNGTEDVATEIDFEGAGFRLGLDAERQSCRNRLRVYSKAASSFLAGRFNGSYFQGQSFDPTVVDTSWEAGRIVPVLDLEAGAGWTSAGGCLRLSVGYVFSAWFNTVQTEEFIQAVQRNDFVDLGSTTTFDGLRATAEIRF
jgi:hypothetical protein